MFKYRKDNVSVLAVIDRRRMKINGRYPVKIEVVCRRVQKYYPTGKDVTIEEWEKMWKGRRVTEKYRSIENTFYIVRTAVEHIANKGRFSFMDLNKRLGYSTVTVNEALNAGMIREEAIKIGLAEGRAEGKAEGRAEGLAEAIRRMLAAGFTTEQICEIMGTTAEEVSAAKGRK